MVNTNFKASVDIDPLMGYETNSIARRILNFFLIPILNSLPERSRFFLKKTHESAREIIDNATTHRALEVLYGHNSANVAGNLTQRLFKFIWLSTNNSKAVRNRLKLVRREVENQIKTLLRLGRPIKILSVASGSSRAIIEAINSIRFESEPDMSITFVDKNQDAIEYSKELSKDHKYFSKFEWFNMTAGNFFCERQDKRFTIVEMVGLIDYFDNEKAVRIFASIFNSLEPGGILITANIDNNAERKFVTKAVGWNMIYRSASQLADLLTLSGFSSDKLRIYYEPQMIHSVIVATK